VHDSHESHAFLERCTKVFAAALEKFSTVRQSSEACAGDSRTTRRNTSEPSRQTPRRAERTLKGEIRKDSERKQSIDVGHAAADEYSAYYTHTPLTRGKPQVRRRSARLVVREAQV
jgi:hypothetical protein